MAETAADRADVDASGKKLRGAEVAEGVEVHAVEAEFVAEAAEGESGVIRAPRLGEIDLVRKHERVRRRNAAALRRERLAGLTVFRQQIRGVGVDRHLPDLVRLG